MFCVVCFLDIRIERCFVFVIIWICCCLFLFRLIVIEGWFIGFILCVLFYVCVYIVGCCIYYVLFCGFGCIFLFV